MQKEQGKGTAGAGHGLDQLGEVAVLAPPTEWGFASLARDSLQAVQASSEQLLGQVSTMVPRIP